MNMQLQGAMTVFTVNLKRLLNFKKKEVKRGFISNVLHLKTIEVLKSKKVADSMKNLQPFSAASTIRGFFLFQSDYIPKAFEKSSTYSLIWMLTPAIASVVASAFISGILWFSRM